MYQFKKQGVKLKVSHNLRNILLIAIILITPILFISAPPSAAQESKGDVITEEGSVIPVEETPVMPDQEGYFIQRDAVKAVREINDFHLLGLSEPEIIEPRYCMALF